MSEHNRKYGEKPSHPIYIWSGILEAKHKEKIGPALWHFIWLINAITREKDGVGLVLGGKPVKMEEVAESLAESARTTRKHFDRLELYGYIERTRTPYGYVFRVLNSRKFSNNKGAKRAEETFRSEGVETGRNLPISLPKPSDLFTQTFRSNKSKQLDESVEEAEKAAAPWKAIGTDKLGTPRFRAKWEFLFAHRNGNPLSDVMERCIVSCQEARIPVPRPFYDAKRKVEASEKEQGPSTHHGKDEGLPYLEPMPPIPCAKKS